MPTASIAPAPAGTGTAARLAARTPDTRDRYVDLLRVASLGVVVLAHWFMAVVTPQGEAGNALTVVTWVQPLTWVLQVMPVFFLVGGFSHATALRSLRRRGGGYADFVRSRAERLLRPTAVFAAAWLAFALAVEVLGHDRGVLRLATRLVAQPLWFVGVYLGLVALAPLMLRLHERHGVAVPVVLGAGAVAVDVARLGLGVDAAGTLNVALVWLAVHQLGFLYADGRLSRRTGAALVAAALPTLTVLTVAGPYPVSMVGLPGERISNMAPPTVAILVQALLLAGLVVLARPAATRWLARPRVWTAVVVANGVAMTAFLWHLTALLLLVAGTSAAGLALPGAGTAAWWVTRPLWFAVLGVLTYVLVLVFRAADAPRPARVVARGDGLAALGVALCVAGVLAFSAVGFGGLLAGRSATLVAVEVTPLAAVALLAAGAGALRLSGGRARGLAGWEAPGTAR